MAANCIEGFFEKDSVGDAGNFHRVLKSKKYTLAGTFFRRQIQQVLSFEANLSLSHLIAVPTIAGAYKVDREGEQNSDLCGYEG